MVVVLDNKQLNKCYNDDSTNCLPQDDDFPNKCTENCNHHLNSDSNIYPSLGALVCVEI